MSNINSDSIDPSEIEKFSRIAEEWWDLNGKFKPLHKINPVRVGYISTNAVKKQASRILEPDNTAKDSAIIHPLKGLHFLDIGCGGGLLSEPMAQLGATVTAIDASEKNIQIARLHAQKSGLDIKYLCTSVEELAASGAQFDVVLNMEVIEHVADVAGFMEASCKLLKPGGVMFLATLNRTIKSFAFAIVGAEYVLGWLPRGTHNWEKFLKPSEVNAYLEKNAIRVEEITGITFSPLKDEWHTSSDIAVNYMLMAVKDK